VRHCHERRLRETEIGAGTLGHPDRNRQPPVAQLNQVVRRWSFAEPIRRDGLPVQRMKPVVHRDHWVTGVVRQAVSSRLSDFTASPPMASRVAQMNQTGCAKSARPARAQPGRAARGLDVARDFGWTAPEGFSCRSAGRTTDFDRQRVLSVCSRGAGREACATRTFHLPSSSSGQKRCLGMLEHYSVPVSS
jgi:hypothetical protein